MPLLTTRQAIAAKVEATEGTAETLTGAEVVRAFNVKFSPNIEENARDPHSTSLSRKPPVKGRSKAGISFDLEMMGSSGAGVAPFWGPILRACGFAETIVGSTSVKYLPATTSLVTDTIKAFKDGISAQLKAARGNVSCELNGGGIPMLKFNFEGIWDPRTDADAWKDEALLVGSAFPTFLPKPFYSANLTIDIYQAVIEKLVWNMNNRIQSAPDANISGVFKRFDIVGRDPSGEIDAEAVLDATKSFMDLFKNGTQFAIDGFAGAEDAGNGTGSLNTMTDSTKNWIASQWATGKSLRDSAGTVFTITANNATTLTVSGTPASGLYEIYTAGQLIQVNLPKVVLNNISDNDAGGIYRLGLPFKFYENAGDDEISLLLT